MRASGMEKERQTILLDKLLSINFVLTQRVVGS